jgi:hypothetical protein
LTGAPARASRSRNRQARCTLGKSGGKRCICLVEPERNTLLAPVERPCGENQEIEIVFGIALAAGARAEQHDLNRCETLAREPRCRLMAARSRSLSAA